MKSSLRVILLVVVIAAVITGAATYLVTQIAKAPMVATMKAVDAARALGKDFQTALQWTPQISVQSTVVVEQNIPAMEVVTVKRDALVRHTITDSWLHSTKILAIEATFTARAGYDFKEPFEMSVEPGSLLVHVRLPRAKILSVEMGDVRLPREEDGYWNKLNSSDRERAMSEIARVARKQFSQTDILLAARSEAEKRIGEIVAAAGYKVQFDSRSEPLP